MNKVILAVAAFVLPLVVAASAPPAGTLKRIPKAVLWSGTVDRDATPPGIVPECAATSCDQFGLTIDLPAGVWFKPGGVEVSIRWDTYGDNLRLYVYQGGTLIASSTGIISTAQSVLIPTPQDGHYTVYVAYDTDSPDKVIQYDGLRRLNTRLTYIRCGASCRI